MLYSFWKTYSPPAKFLLHAYFCLENDHIDVFEFLVAQEEDALLRYSLGPQQLMKMFEHTKLFPIKVQNPAQPKEMMLGVAAEEDIAKDEIIGRANGFFWPKMSAMPTTAEKGFGPYMLERDVPVVWGFERKVPAESRPSGFRFMLNASDAMSLVNDHRGLAEKPNAEFISFTATKLGDEHPTDTLQLGIKAITDIKKGEQILVAYGEDFWSNAGRDPSPPSEKLLDAISGQPRHVPNKIYEEGDAGESDDDEEEVNESKQAAQRDSDDVQDKEEAVDLTEDTDVLPGPKAGDKRNLDASTQSPVERKKRKVQNNDQTEEEQARAAATKAKKAKAIAAAMKKVNADAKARKAAKAKKTAKPKATAKPKGGAKAKPKEAAKTDAAKKPEKRKSDSLEPEQEPQVDSLSVHKHTLPSHFALQRVCPLISAGRNRNAPLRTTAERTLPSQHGDNNRFRRGRGGGGGGGQ